MKLHEAQELRTPQRQADPGRDPRVTVIVPVHNVEAYVGATLDSLARQSFSDFEIIVVDDGSTDATVDAVQRHPDPRIRLFKHLENQGPAAARNTALERARGSYIALLDADDLAVPERLAVQVAALDADPGLAMIGSQVGLITQAGARTSHVLRRPVTPEQAEQELLFRNTLSAVMMFRRSCTPAGGFRALPMAEDYDFNVRVAALGRIANADQILTLVRTRAGSLTQSRQELMEACVRDVMREQLLALGVEPSQHELNLNRHVGAYTLPNSVGLLREVEAWLLKLRTANLRSRRYPDESFVRTLAHEWYEVCKFAAPLGRQALRVWRSSPLLKYWEPPALELVRFHAKCLLRHERSGGDVPALA
jgi:glycosyltransferase involved in cell wall biosynthesis